MKSALTLLVMLILFTSCGKKSEDCKSRETMRIECQARSIPNYGYPYAQEMCNRTYSSDRCYQDLIMKYLFLALNFALIIALCRLSYVQGRRDSNFDIESANRKIFACMEVIQNNKR